MIYVIGPELGPEGGPCKIGTANNCHARLATLQTSSWLDFYIYAEIEGSYWLEGEIQEHFKSKLIRGEWFQLTYEDIELIQNWHGQFIDDDGKMYLPTVFDFERFRHQLLAWCGRCEIFHTHGTGGSMHPDSDGTWGHRTAHCSKSLLENDAGYYLKPTNPEDLPPRARIKYNQLDDLVG